LSRILLLSYYFPPIGGAGAQRPAKFARYLHDRGHEVVVLTGSGQTGEFWAPADPTLAVGVPPEVEVIRVRGPEARSSGRWRKRLERMAALEDSWARWWQDGIARAGETIGDVDVVYTIMSPFSSAKASKLLSRSRGIQWIADLGDPWALDEMMIYPTELHRRLEIRRMRKRLGTAAAIVMSTSEAVKQLLAAFPELNGRPVVAIPNGYDAADFAEPVRAQAEQTAFRIVHTGYLHTETGLGQRRRSRVRRFLGGSDPGVDILTRSHVYLLEAVDKLLAQDPTLRDRLEVHLAGVLTPTDLEIAERSPVTVVHGYLPHADSIALIRSADLLFLPMQNLPPGRRSSTVPGKTYEYLATGRPILGAVPPGDTRDFLEQSGRALVCDPDDVEAMTRAIAHAADDPLGDRFSYERLAGEVERLVREIAVGGNGGKGG
jgi:glycosyltransferase involved in cell wall biosynthesis